MMTNLFSIFDPSSSLLNSNWTSSLIVISMVTPPFWASSNHLQLMKLFFYSTYSSLSQTLMKKTMIFYFMSSIFFLILTNNLSSLLPLIFPVNSHISVILPLGLSLWAMPLMLSWIKSPMSSFKSMLPQGTPPILMPFMVLIETISILIRPVTLSVRLIANITAGHLLLSILVSLIMSIKLNVASVVPILLMNLLEMGVSIIQAYVFFTLVSMYTSEI